MNKKLFLFAMVVLAILYITILKLQGFELSLFSNVNLYYAFLAFATLCFILFLRGLKYWFLLRCTGVDAGKEAFPTVILGFYSNFISPIRISELVRSFIIRQKTGKPFFKILSPTVIDSLIDTSAMILVIVFLSLFVTLAIDYFSKLFLIGVFLVLIFAMFFLISTRKGEGITTTLIKKLSSRILKGKAEVKPAEFIKTSRGFLTNWKMVLLVFMMAVMIWFFEGLKLYFMVLASGLSMSIFMTTLIITIAYLIGGSFINPSGITQEAVLLVLLLQLPFEKTGLMLAASMDALISVGTILIIGTLLLLRFGVQILKVRG